MKKSAQLPSVVTLIAGSLLFLMPFYLMMAMAMKDKIEVSHTDVWSWPKNPTFDNFKEVFTNPSVPFKQLFGNTLVISLLATIGVVLTASIVAFGFARLKFRGRDRLFIVLLSTMMLPGIITQIPSYLMFKELHWINTIYPLVVPAFFGGGAFNIFLLRQFFMGLPRELDEAAILDGASNARIFWQIIMPLSGPALATVTVLTFIYNWRDFFGPLLYLNSNNKQTLEVGLATYNSLRDTEWQLIMAGAVMVSIPLIIIFFVGQRWFIRGIAMTGGK